MMTMKNLIAPATSIIALIALCVACRTIPESSNPATEAGRAFLQACGHRDWQEAGHFYREPVPEAIKQWLGGVEIIRVGQSYERIHQYEGRFVPYKIRFADGKVLMRTLAMKSDPAGNWFVDGGL